LAEGAGTKPPLKLLLIQPNCSADADHAVGWYFALLDPQIDGVSRNPVRSSNFLDLRKSRGHYTTSFSFNNTRKLKTSTLQTISDKTSDLLQQRRASQNVKHVGSAGESVGVCLRPAYLPARKVGQLDRKQV